MDINRLFWRFLSPESGKEEAAFPPSREQIRVLHEFNQIAVDRAAKLGMTRRRFILSQLGCVAFFVTMNKVHGRFFEVSPAEAADPGVSEEKAKSLSGQFIFDVQIHYVRKGYLLAPNLLSLRRRARDWNPDLKGKEQNPQDIEFENFYREVFERSQTKVGLLSNAPADDPKKWFLTNEQAIQTRQKINEQAGKRRLLAHWVITPGQPKWMEEFEKGIESKPDSWKGYTLGDPRGESKYPWRLDDEKLVYPAYEKLSRAGIRNVCIHKGLLPSGYQTKLTREQVESAKVNDVGKAAKDWPNLNFIIYHSAIEKNLPDARDEAEFRKTGRINWITDLAEIPDRYGVTNVYAELGAVFATTSIAHPEFCAGILGTLIRGMGADHVCWGTDSVWFGSPRWQIEAMRRIEIPGSMQKQHGFRPLGPANGTVKKAILGENSARLYSLDPSIYKSG